MKKFVTKEISLITIVLSFLLIACKDQPKSGQTGNLDSAHYMVKHPDWIKSVNIYEVNLRQYTKSGTIKEFMTHLPRLKEMGVEVLWFMPITPIGEKNRKGKLGSYYSVKDYKAVNPEFGTIDDFKKLVTEIHQLGMYVLIDWVPNHSAWDNDWAIKNPDYYTKDSLGNFIPPVGTDWTDVIDLNYDNQNMRAEMISALKFWIDSTKIDGFRCDHAAGVPTDFWNQASIVLDSIKPVFMLAEAEQPDHQYTAFDAGYAWTLHHLMHAIAKGEKNVADLDAYFAIDTAVYDPNAIMLQFTTNHDENSWNGTEYEKFGEATKTFSVLTYTVPGIPLIYSGQEAGLKKRLLFFEKDEIDWHANKELFGFFKSLNALKKEQPALWNGEFGAELKRIKTDADSTVFAFVRENKDSKVLVITNLTKNIVKVKLETNDDFTNLKSYFSKYSFTGKEMTLNPWEYLVFVK
jgi:glycosidase